MSDGMISSIQHSSSPKVSGDSNIYDMSKRRDESKGVEKREEPKKTVSVYEKKRPEGEVQSLSEGKEEKVEKEEKKVDHKDVQMNGQVIRFSFKDKVNEETGKIEKSLVVSVVDENTGETLRTIPPEELTDPRSGYRSLTGIMFDKLG